MMFRANRQRRLNGSERGVGVGGGLWSGEGWRGWAWIGGILSGVLLVLVYPPFGWEWLVWVWMVPWLLGVWSGVRRLGLGESFLVAWVCGSVFFLGSLVWITEVTAGGWVALSIYCGLYFGVYGVFLWGVGMMGLGGWVSSFWNVVVCFLGGVVWVGLEVVRGVAFSGFGWNLLGVGLWRNVAMIQIAELTGVVGVSFVVVVVNLCFGVTVMRLVEELRSGRIRPHYDFALVVGGCALVFVFGVERLFRREESGVVERLRVAAVQANIPQEEKWDIAYERKILEKYERLTEYGMMVGPDLLAWPEAAMPRAVFSDREVYSFVMGLAKRMEGDFVFGTVHFDQSGDYNSIVLLGGVSKEPQFYHKIHLVPFGEFVPFRESFPLFAWIVGELVPSDFDAGRGVVVLKMERKDLRIGPLVCFEDTIGDLARRFVMGGADFFVNVTNDGWFRRSAGSEQHLAQAVFRCVENRVPMLRVANTGVTCWIDRWGRVVEKLTGEDGSTFVEGVMVGEFEVPKGGEETFYTRYGELFGWGCLWVGLVGSVILYYWRRGAVDGGGR